MTSARKILDVHGQDPAELAREIASLPHGRYVLVPENELGAEHDVSEPTAQQTAELNEAIAEVSRGGSLSLEEFGRQLDSRIRTAVRRQ